jgi:serine protease Do
MRGLTVILRRALALTLLLVAACGGEAAVTTTSAPPTTIAATTTTTTVASSTTTAPATNPDDKPADDRVDGLALAGGFQGGVPPTEVPTDPAVGDYSGYQEIVDENGILTVTVPVEWTDVFSGPWTDNIWGVEGGEEGIGIVLGVAPDLDAWTDTWGTPGLFFGVSELLGGTVAELLDGYSYLADECTYDGRYEYDDGAYVGAVDWWNDCGGVGTAYAVIVARPPGEEFTVVVEITMVTEADVAAADQIVSSFYVVALDDNGGGALDTEAEPNYGTG